jgi:hypothetical protein
MAKLRTKQVHLCAWIAESLGLDRCYLSDWRNGLEAYAKANAVSWVLENV